MSSELLANLHLPVNHVFVDLENVKVIDPTTIGGKNLKFHLFFGPENAKLDLLVVEKLLENAQTVQMIRSPEKGKNALDFVLAYHLGQAVMVDPKAYFHIVSKDKGFDSLVALLKSRHVKVKRHDDWASLNFLAQSKPVSIAQAPVMAVVPDAVPAPKAPAQSKVQAVSKGGAPSSLSAGGKKLYENLDKLTSPKRPKKVKTLIAHALSLNGKDKPNGESLAGKHVEELKKNKLITVDDKGAVKYLF